MKCHSKWNRVIKQYTSLYLCHKLHSLKQINWKNKHNIFQLWRNKQWKRAYFFSYLGLTWIHNCVHTHNKISPLNCDWHVISEHDFHTFNAWMTPPPNKEPIQKAVAGAVLARLMTHKTFENVKRRRHLDSINPLPNPSNEAHGKAQYSISPKHL